MKEQKPEEVKTLQAQKSREERERLVAMIQYMQGKVKEDPSSAQARTYLAKLKDYNQHQR